MTALPIAFRTNESKYSFLGTPRLINCYAESDGRDTKSQGKAKNVLAVLPSAGLTEFAEPTDRPCRGTLYAPDLDTVFHVHSTSVYKTTYDGTTATSTRLGVIPGTDPVQMSRNQSAVPQISIHCDAGEFYLEMDVVKSVTDTDLIDDVVSADNVSGYTVYGGRTGQFQISAINDCASVDGTDDAIAEQSPDGLVRVVGDRGELFLFGERTVEQWRDTGQADFPFEPMAGATIQKGLLAFNGVAACDNTLFWPGHDNVVYRLNGSNAQRVSTHGIERTIKAEPSQTDIQGFAYDDEGHSFYTLTGTDWTRSYDAATGVWHSRESYGIGKWRAVYPFRAWGKVIFGDTESGKLLELDSNSFTEDGRPLVWGVDSPIMHTFPNGGIVDAMFIDVATGVGAITGLDSETDPSLMLSWSTDGGATFKGNREIPLGAYGDRVRLVTRRLGRFDSRGIMFRLRISDPVIRALLAIDLSIRPIKK